MPSKTILITGGNDGIGKATAQVLLERGHEVVIAGRDTQRLAAAVDNLKYRTQSDKVSALLCDLADLQSVQQAAETFLMTYPRLDVLINNAGVFTNDFQLSKDGIEMQMAVNYLGHFALTEALIPALQCAREPRVINVASVAHLYGKLDFQNLERLPDEVPYDGLAAYARSKLANVLYSREFAKRHEGITANCLHPGVVRTRIANKYTTWYFSLFWSLYKPFMRSTRSGARTIVYLALSPEVRNVSGRYFDDRQCCRKPAEAARDEQLGAQLWEWSQAMVGKVMK